MKALVVGGTGPTGPLVVAGLARRGYKVTLLHSGKHEVHFDIPVDHLHAEVHFPEPLAQILEGRSFDLVVGMYGRLRYLAEVVKGKTPRFIAIGGMPYEVFVAGNKSDKGVPVFVREDAPLFRDETKNKFTYLMTVSEETVMDAHAQGAYNATLLRFPMIYGPRQVAPREWCILRRILDGRKRLILPDGGLKLERRGYADNAAHAVLLAVDQPEKAAGQIYNVGDELIWSLKNWVDAIASSLHHEWEVVSLPFAIARPSRPYAGRDFHWLPDIHKIREDLGYRDPVSPVEGLRRTVSWYLKERPEPGGEVERNLGDVFDYEAEDKLIKNYESLLREIKAHLPSGYRFHHAYRHPSHRVDEKTHP